MIRGEEVIAILRCVWENGGILIDGCRNDSPIHLVKLEGELFVKISAARGVFMYPLHAVSCFEVECKMRLGE